MTSYYIDWLQLLFLVGICSQSILGCGYQTCPQQYDENKIHLHIISHSHDDVGWLKTADEYYDQDVRHVLTNVVNSLQRNKNRRFVQVEMYYFTRWWQRQTLETQNIVQKLVQDGQLSFANGGWCMNDEASANYNQIIDQMTLGIQFIRNTFGECAKPNVSWQIDPFGASQEMVNLYSLMNFDGLVVNRGYNLSGEFIWSTNSFKIFTTRLHHHYSAPNGFNFEDADEITEKNKLEKSIIFANLGRQWNKDYGSTGHVLITFGDDFRYKNAEGWYTNLDKLIEVVNQYHIDINLFYSSPHCYIKAINDRKPKFEIKYNDYFPLWTGFYSSRPIIKYLDRYTNNLFQAAKQLEVMAELNDTQEYIQEAANEISVLQHHDALPGTSVPSVMVDYKQRLLNAIDASQFVISRGLAKLANLTINPYIYTSANISQLDIDLKDVDEFSVIVYNPLAHWELPWLRIPVDGEHDYTISYLNETNMRTENVQIVPINDKVRSMVGHSEKYTHELVFNASLPPLGYKTFIIKKNQKSFSKINEKKIKVNSNNDYVLKGKNFHLIVDGHSGKVKYWNSRRLIQSFQYYISNRTSSSYEFCPNGGTVDMTDYESRLISAIQNNGFAEITQRINDWVWQTIRVYENKEYAEFDWVIGPVSDQLDNVGKDVIIRFETDLETDSKFYTDSNGREPIERTRDEVPRECMKTKNAISYNYYPVTSYTMLSSSKEKMDFIVLTDRSVGVSSLHDGQIELMVHRRLFDDKRTDIPVNDLDLDGKGVIARGKFLVLFDEQVNQADHIHSTSRQLLLQPIMAFIPFSLQNLSNDYRFDFTGIGKPLQNNIHLVSMENHGKYESNEILIRLENLYQSDKYSNTKLDSKFFLQSFSHLEIKQIEKTNLVGTERSLVDLWTNNETFIWFNPKDISTLILTINREMVNRSSCEFKWSKLLPSKQLPNNSIVAGQNPDGTPLYVCRHQKVDNIPGKYDEKIQCHITYGGKEFHFNDDQVEILTAPTEYHPRWIPRHGGDLIPESAFAAGKTKSGQPIYIGRCHRHGTVVGKIDEYFYYPYGDVELRDCPNHQILVC